MSDVANESRDGGLFAGAQGDSQPRNAPGILGEAALQDSLLVPLRRVVAFPGGCGHAEAASAIPRAARSSA